jgi:hypothetical protein
MIDETLYAKLYRGNTLKRQLQETPQPAKPIITQSDANTGFVTRYFVRAANDKSSIVEVDEAQSATFEANPRFITAELRWKIRGKKDTTISNMGARDFGVRDYNKMLVERQDLTFGGLSTYIFDYLEYWVSE